MKPSVLRQLFEVETHRQKASHVGFSVPVLSEVEVGLAKNVSPMLATNMRGKFLHTKVSSSGVARFAFSEVPLDQEDSLLVELHRTLKDFMRPRPLEGAYLTMEGKGLKPHSLVSPELIEHDSLKVFHCPDLGSPLLVASPDRTGMYTRIGDYVGVIAYNVGTTFSLVEL